MPNPFLGRLLDYGVDARPSGRSRACSRCCKLDGNRFTDPVDHRQEFNVKILRSTTTYQFTPRLLIRNITELNTGAGSNHTLFQNILVTYRVNSGTVFYVGYDDRFKEGNAVNAQVFSGSVVSAHQPRGLHEDSVPVQERRQHRLYVAASVSFEH